ncbi:unnamed protein product, partial [Iphiclides podalirius]
MFVLTFVSRCLLEAVAGFDDAGYGEWAGGGGRGGRGRGVRAGAVAPQYAKGRAREWSPLSAKSGAAAECDASVPPAMATLGLSKVFILDKYFTELQKFWETEKKLQGERACSAYAAPICVCCDGPLVSAPPRRKLHISPAVNAYSTAGHLSPPIYVRRAAAPSRAALFTIYYESIVTHRPRLV